MPDRTEGVPYLAGLDGMRALAVIAVMVYHANAGWLPGGFLGVEVFFVISGYLITLLLISEHERTGRIRIGEFWKRRARRLLPALGVLLLLVVSYAAVFRADALGRLRGSVVAGIAYGANWYQIAVDAGYAAAGDFAPLRHLWSLAVEEQFYLLWPLVMVLLLRRHRGPDLRAVAWKLAAVAVVIVGITAIAQPSGPIGTCATTPDAYWSVAGRCLSKANVLYLSTITRSAGILLGAAFAMFWGTGGGRTTRTSHSTVRIDLVAVGAVATLLVLVRQVGFIGPSGVDGFLFRGGLLLTDLATLALIGAVTSRTSYVAAVLGARPLVWIGLRSYGLYLFHWPVYQAIRRVSGVNLTVTQLAVATAITIVITELSYRFVELPIRRLVFVETVAGFWRRRPDTQPIVSLGVAASVVVGSFGLVQIARADNRPNEIELSIDAGRDATTSLEELLSLSPASTDESVADVIPRVTVLRPSRSETTPSVVQHTSPATSTTVSTPTSLPVAVVTPSIATAPVVAVVSVAPATLPTDAPPSTSPSVDAAPPATPPPATPPVVTAPPSISTPAEAPAAPRPNQVSQLAIGDSVLLGAASPLADRGWVVNAVVSRQPWDLAPILRQLRDADVLGDVVAIALGTNGTFSDSLLDQTLDLLAGVPRVILVTAHANKSWVSGNNALVRARAGGNVVVLDWDELARSCPGNCFEDDGIHLRADGRRYYGELLTQAANS